MSIAEPSTAARLRSNQLGEHCSPAVSINCLQQLKAREQIFRVIRRATGTFELHDDLALLTNLVLHACNFCFYFCQAVPKGSAIHGTFPSMSQRKPHQKNKKPRHLSQSRGSNNAGYALKPEGASRASDVLCLKLVASRKFRFSTSAIVLDAGAIMLVPGSGNTACDENRGQDIRRRDAHRAHLHSCFVFGIVGNGAWPVTAAMIQAEPLFCW